MEKKPSLFVYAGLGLAVAGLSMLSLGVTADLVASIPPLRAGETFIVPPTVIETLHAAAPAQPSVSLFGLNALVGVALVILGAWLCVMVVETKKMAPAKRAPRKRS